MKRNTSTTPSEDRKDSLKETLPTNHDSAESCTEDSNFEYVIDRLIRYRQTPRDTYPLVRWYGYDQDDGTYELEFIISVEFVAR